MDQSSGYLHVEFQSSLTTHQTLEAKEKFELLCLDFHIRPQANVSDQGTAFTSQEFARHLSAFSQIHLLTPPGGHHQNIAKQAIGTITQIARTMMLHSAIHWPEVSDSQLWPMAVWYAVNIYNHMPCQQSGLPLLMNSLANDGN